MPQVTHEEFMRRFNITGPKNVEVLGVCKGITRHIAVRCKTDGYEWSPLAGSLLKGYGCPVCSGLAVKEGCNDIATVRPDLVKYFVNKNDAKTHVQCSNAVVELVCPNCGEKKTGIIYNLSRGGFSCQRCGDSISYPNKFGRSFIQQTPATNIQFEYRPEWLKPYRYDVYFEYFGKSYILEMDGGLGHGYKDFHSQKQDERGLKRDQIKDELAKEHGLSVIRIDSRYSRKEYIVNNILNSELANIFDLKEIDWNECEKATAKNYMKEICDFYNQHPYMKLTDIAKEFGVVYSTVSDYLQKGNLLGWCNYDHTRLSRRMTMDRAKRIIVYDLNHRKIHELDSVRSCVFFLEKKYGVKYWDSSIYNVIHSGKRYKQFYFSYAPNAA